MNFNGKNSITEVEISNSRISYFLESLAFLTLALIADLLF